MCTNTPKGSNALWVICKEAAFCMTFTVLTSGDCNLSKGDLKVGPLSITQEHLPAVRYVQHVVNPAV